MHQVIDQWNNNKVVYSGSKEQCEKYIQSNIIINLITHS